MAVKFNGLGIRVKDGLTGFCEGWDGAKGQRRLRGGP